MKKAILFFSILFSFLTTQAQDTGWETGVNLSAGSSAHLNHTINAKKVSLYYSVGVYGRKFFKQKYGIEAGINYTSLSLKYEIAITDVNGNIIDIGKSNFRHNYVEIPVRFVFKNDFKMISVGCYAGISPAFLTHAYTRLTYRDDQSIKQEIRFNETNNVRNFNLIVDAGLLLRFNVSSHFAIDAKPFFRAQVFPLSKAGYPSSPGAYPYAVGISAATVWKF